jgi:hypothetical protein
LIPSLDPNNEANTFEIRLKLKNTAPGPLRFLVESYEYSLTSETRTTGPRAPSTIHVNGEMTYFPSGGFSRQQYESFGARTHGVMTYSIVYGHPDIGFTRRMTARFHLDYFRLTSNVTIHWLVREQEDIEITTLRVVPRSS